MFFLFFASFIFIDDILKDKPSITACLLDLNSSLILYEKNAHEKKHPYSTTKLATALFFLENYPVELQKIMQVEPRHLLEFQKEDTTRHLQTKSDASVIGLRAYDYISIQSLLYGMLLPSGCDAANVIASSYEKNMLFFVKKMNSFLSHIGCKNTLFTNPHGYPNPIHKTTAYDLAQIAQRALKIEFLKKIISTPKTEIEVISSEGQKRVISLLQTNKFLLNGRYFYPKAYGLKTGSSCPFSHNLIVCASHKNHHLLLVLLDAKTDHDRYSLSRTILDKAFELLD
jgi:D-alanyl-D-alanine carboxypeptidase (penicillin-binding protein 5/6)